MSSGVFIIRKNGSLVEMKLSDYESEAVLQKLISKYPNLLPGDQIDVVNPRKWLLVSEEFGVPDKKDAKDRWSLDHLFLDQDGIPTLVEVKRSSNTRIRREVVGQMLDYAANAEQYWSIDRITTAFENKCLENDIDPQEEWEGKLGLDGSYQEYWDKVKTNLEIAKMRLLFVADRIPFELQRIVEFMNTTMPEIVVLAIELQQYKEPDSITQLQIEESKEERKQHIEPELKTLIPRVYGHTTKTQARLSRRRRGQLDKKTLLESVDDNGKPLFEAFISLAEKNQYNGDYGEDSYSIYTNIDGKDKAFTRGFRKTKSMRQSLFIFFKDLLDKNPSFTDIYKQFKKRFMATKKFDKSGDYNLRWVINKPVSEKEIDEVITLIKEYAEEIAKWLPSRHQNNIA
jgi:hypothetical protein